MKASPRRKRTLANLPLDVHRWLEECAAHYGTSVSGEIIRSVRERQAREQTPALAAPRKAMSAE